VLRPPIAPALDRPSRPESPARHLPED